MEDKLLSLLNEYCQNEYYSGAIIDQYEIDGSTAFCVDKYGERYYVKVFDVLVYVNSKMEDCKK